MLIPPQRRGEGHLDLGANVSPPVATGEIDDMENAGKGRGQTTNERIMPTVIRKSDSSDGETGTRQAVGGRMK